MEPLLRDTEREAGTRRNLASFFTIDAGQVAPRFLWVSGRWVDGAGHGTLWQDGYWRREGSGYEWVPAHWM